MSIVFDMPKWYTDARVGDEQRTPSGATWTVKSVTAGGRRIEFEAADGRKASAEASPDHPEYPSDADVVASERARRKAEKAAAAQGIFNWFPKP